MRKSTTKADIDVLKALPPEKLELSRGTANTLKAVASGPAADYFFVMTLQKGQPPKIEAQGSGINAKVKVGKRTVRFSGERLVIE